VEEPSVFFSKDRRIRIVERLVETRTAVEQKAVARAVPEDRIPWV